jgi:hypothetical protein
VGSKADVVDVQVSAGTAARHGAAMVIAREHLAAQAIGDRLADPRGLALDIAQHLRVA